MTGSRFPSASDVHPSGVLRGRLVRPLALLAITWVAACGGDGGTTEPEPAPQPNRPPAASGSIPSQTMTAGESVTVSVGGLFSDPDGDALTLTTISSNPSVASVALSGTDLTVTAVAAGNATVTVTARDPSGLSTAASANVTVMEPNRAPMAPEPVVSAHTAIVGDTLNIDVSPFFTDPDGDALTYSATSANASVATVTVAGSVVSAAAVGAGSTTLTVTATDPDGLSGSLSVPVTVEPNLPPEATQDSLPSLSIQERNSETVNVAQYFNDPNEHALTYEAESSNTGVATVSVSGSTMTVTAVAMGPATLTVTATDPYGLTASLTGRVEVIERVNQAPEAQVEIDPIARTVGWMLTVELEGDDPFFADPDGDELTYSAESSDPGVATATVSGSDLTLTAVAAGTATITVTATDPGGLSASIDFELTVLPAAETVFRDDFEDDTSLDNWDLILASAAVSDGTLQLRSDSAGFWGIAAREQDPPLTSWEIRVRLARTKADSMRTSVGFSVVNPGEEFNFQWFRLDIGTSVLNFTEPETVNYALAAYFTPPDQEEGPYYLPRTSGFRGVSDAINDGAGEFTEITIRVQDGIFEILADTETLFSSPAARWIFDSAVREINEVHVWSVDPAATDPSLFDWIEVNGVPTESSATAGNDRSRVVVPMDVNRDVGVMREASPRIVGEGPPQRSLTPGRE